MTAFIEPLLLSALGLYVLVVAALYVFQRRLVFDIRPLRLAPAEVGLPEAQEHVLATADGERIVTWLKRPDGPARPLFLMCLGNGDNLGAIAPRLKALGADGSGYLAVAYRGYSGSTGRPSEAGVTRDAEAAYAFAVGVVAPRRVVVFGYSLGSGVAVPLAARHEVGAVVLLAPFTSAVDIGAAQYPFIPVRYLMKDRFPSIEVVGKLRAPILVLHGEADEVVPIRFGRALFAAAPEPKRFVPLPGTDHFSILERGGLPAIRAFLDEFGPR